MFRRTANTLIGLGLLGTVVFLAACGENPNEKDNHAARRDLYQLETSQPSPFFKWSQLRQTLIDIETAQAHGSQTTSFFFNLGVEKPLQSCPSVGFPVATTTELTNPLQEHNSVAVGQIDPTGVYTGSSTGTYVVCVNHDGSTYAHYWEGYVDTVSGPAVWDEASHSVKMTGPSSVELHTH